MNYKDLDYPMFETTVGEKYILLKILVLYYLTCNSSVFLCYNLRRLSGGYSIVRKIQKVLGNRNTLEWYFEMDCLSLGVKDREKLRKIWIRKLLSYNPPVLELQPV